MATLEENINQAISDFDDIKAAMEEKGLEVPDGTDTKEYGDLIRSLYVGGIVDQTYDPEGINALSGKAVAEALKTIHVTYLESTDSENYLNLFDLESGTYILQGVFYVYPNAPKRYTFSKRVLVSVSHGTKSTCVQVFYPPWNTIQYLNIWTDEESETGYSYERKDAELYYMEDTRNKVTNLDENADDEHYPSALAVKKAVGNASNAIKANASGEVIRVDDVSPIEHTAKAKVSGKNLAAIQRISNIGTMDFSIDGNSVIIAPREHIYGVRFTQDVLGLKVGTTYTASLGSVTDHANAWGWRVLYADGSYIFSDGNKSIQYTFTPQKEVSAVQFYFGFPYTGNQELVISNIQIEEGDTATEYEPYIDPTTVTLTRCGKNINEYPYYDTTEKTQNGLTFTCNEDGSLLINGTASAMTHYSFHPNYDDERVFIKKGTYTLSLHGRTISGLALTMIIGDSKGTSIRSETCNSNLTITIEEDCYYWLFITIDAGTFINAVTVYPQIEVGGTATKFEKYNGEVYTPNADGTLDIVSVSPTMTLLTDTAGVNIDLVYNQDSNKAMENVNKDIKTLDDDMAEIKGKVTELEEKAITATVTHDGNGNVTLSFA